MIFNAQKLDNTLKSLDCPKSLGEVFFFLRGLLAGSKMMVPSAWLGWLFDGKKPVFDSQTQVQTFMDNLMGLWNLIASAQNNNGDISSPIQEEFPPTIDGIKSRVELLSKKTSAFVQGLDYAETEPMEMTPDGRDALKNMTEVDVLSSNYLNLIKDGTTHSEKEVKDAHDRLDSVNEVIEDCIQRISMSLAEARHAKVPAGNAPKKKQTFHSVDEAMLVLDRQRKGIPFEAIRYLRNQPASEIITRKIIFALEHAYDDTYYDEDLEFLFPTPLWYAIVAETHITKNLVDPVIELFTTTYDDWDFLNEQGMFLLGKLAARFPDPVMEKIVEAVDGMVEEESDIAYLYLFDAFSYADVAKYKEWFLKTLQKDALCWNDAFAQHIAYLQIKEAIPIIKELYEKSESHDKVEFKEALEELETGIDKYPEQSKPFCETRGDWEEYYHGIEDRFYDDADNDDDDEWEPPKQTPVKVENVGRNKPCPCGSGKKFKKCCLH